MLGFILELIRVCLREGLVYLVENPLNSWMWKQPGWNHLVSDWRRTDFLVDFCVFGTPWKKPTRLRTNGQLGGQRMRCGGTCVHRQLRGREAGTGRSLTKLAEPYPKRLCTLLAQALCQDAPGVLSVPTLGLVRLGIQGQGAVPSGLTSSFVMCPWLSRLQLPCKLRFGVGLFRGSLKALGRKRLAISRWCLKFWSRCFAPSGRCFTARAIRCNILDNCWRQHSVAARCAGHSSGRDGKP